MDVYVSASDTLGLSTATITLTTGYGKKKEIKVTRGAAEPRMVLYDDYYGKNVTSMNFPVSVSGASKYVYVNSNIPLEDIDIENTASDWCEARLEKEVAMIPVLPLIMFCVLQRQPIIPMPNELAQ